MPEEKNLKVVIENKFKNPKWRTFFLLGVIIVLILTNWTSCENRMEDKKLYEQNQQALKKELKVEENKNGELQTSVEVFKGNIKDLEGYSTELADEVKNLKNRKPIFITKFKTIYETDTFIVDNTVVDTFGLRKNEYRLSWDYASLDSTRFLEGNSIFRADINGDILKITPGITSITRDELTLDFTVGLVKNKKTGFEEIFVTPKNPNVTIGSLEGAIIQKRRKIGINLSVSAGYGAVYTNGKIGLGPFIGISISKPLLKL